MKRYVVGVLLLVLISGCIKISSNPTGGVVVNNIPEEKPVEQPQQQPETAAETNIAPVLTIPEKEEENITKEEEPENPNVKVVEIRDLKLYPKELRINIGNTVVWKHKDRFQDRPDIRHQIAHFYNKFRSPVLYYGGSFNYTFNQTGEYGYVDVVFKEKSDLRGKIIVE